MLLTDQLFFYVVYYSGFQPLCRVILGCAVGNYQISIIGLLFFFKQNNYLRIMYHY